MSGAGDGAGVTARRESPVWLAATPAIVAIGAMVAAAGSHHGSLVFGVPLFALCVACAFVMQWIAFVPAFVTQTERFFDLTGSLTFVSVTVIAVVLGPAIDGRRFLLVVLVIIWAVRLGSFLLQRVRQAGGDARFDDIKSSFARFLMTWTLQGLWVTFTLAAALAAITTTERRDLGVTALVGAAVWIVGFAFEVVSDRQKRRFRANPANRGRFIDSGLWSRSRHPNYFGEIVLWTGVAIVALPVLQGWQWVTLASPVFVALLLMYVSGVPMLERRADDLWGGQEDYDSYKARTPVLVPRLWQPRAARGEKLPR